MTYNKSKSRPPVKTDRNRSHTSRQKGSDENLHLLEILKTENSGFLEAEGIEKTHKITQEQLVAEVPLQSAKKRFDLKLSEGGSYLVDYTRSGRHLLLGGRQGHVASMEWETGKLCCELNLGGERVRAIKWLMNESMFAVSQQKYVYIYDGQGTEMHRLQKHLEVDHLEYLPYHFLLASVGGQGILRYHDVTSGQIINEITTKVGKCKSMKLNPYNGVIHLGHAGGYLTMWSPAVGSPLVTMQCHQSPIDAIAIDHQGLYMATSGLDGKVTMWDLRTYKKLHDYHPVRPAKTLDISQKGVLAAGYGPHVTMWKDCHQHHREPYMHHLQAGATIDSVRFCQFDDVLGIGHNLGFSSILVPGSGEPNYDSFEINPFASKKQRREAEVKQLLDKLPPETIMLDPSSIGSVARTEEERHQLKAEIEFSARNAPGSTRKPRVKRLNKEARERLKRRENIIDEEKAKLRETLIINNGNRPRESEVKTLLDRFKLKSL